MHRVPDLNIDLGELPDEPAALYALAHRVNIACGGHAGDLGTMAAACRLARAANARVGAHPSYDDRAGFGRTEMRVPVHDLRNSVRRQCAALASVAVSEGIAIGHVKPHGALYHAAAQDPKIASAVIDGCLDALGPVEFVGPPGSALAVAATARGLGYLCEGFADRRYTASGTLVPRGLPDAVITDPTSAACAARDLSRQSAFDTLCVHGDNPNAVAVAMAVRRVLDALAVGGGDL